MGGLDKGFSFWFPHSEGAFGAFTRALRQASTTEAGWDPTSHPGAPVTVGPHHGLHRMAPDPHGSLEEGIDDGGYRGREGHGETESVKEVLMKMFQILDVNEEQHPAEGAVL